MWQVYLYLANERQQTEARDATRRRAAGGSRIRRWRTARRSGQQTQRAAAEAR
jgi:hypothetical protein